MRRQLEEIWRTELPESYHDLIRRPHGSRPVITPEDNLTDASPKPLPHASSSLTKAPDIALGNTTDKRPGTLGPEVAAVVPKRASRSKLKESVSAAGSGDVREVSSSPPQYNLRSTSVKSHTVNTIQLRPVLKRSNSFPGRNPSLKESSYRYTTGGSGLAPKLGTRQGPCHNGPPHIQTH